MDTLIRVSGAAATLGISIRQVYRLIDAGVLTPVRLPSTRGTFFRAEQLDQIIALASEKRQAEA